MASGGGDPKLGDLVHDRQEKIGVAIPALVETVEVAGLHDGIEAAVAQIAPDAGVILLFNQAIIVGLPGATAREFDLGVVLGEEGQQMRVQKLAPVVRVDLAHRAGPVLEQAMERVAHHEVTAAQNSAAATPTGGYIHALQGVHVFTRRCRTAMMHQVEFEMARCTYVAGDAVDRNLSLMAIGRSGRPVPAFHQGQWRELLAQLALPTEERGITFINGDLSAMPGLQPDLGHVLAAGDRVALFHQKSMWPFQYRHDVAMVSEMQSAVEQREDQGRRSRFDEG